MLAGGQHGAKGDGQRRGNAAAGDGLETLHVLLDRSLPIHRVVPRKVAALS